jgi:hypothetical protein
MSILIALQTVAVAMDDHKPHESNLAEITQLDESEQDSANSKQQPSNTQSDCSHYCQCHSLAKFFKEPSDDLDKKMASVKLDQTKFNYSSIISALYLPPPIS